MNSISEHPAKNMADSWGSGELNSRLQFLKNLQEVTNKIHSSANIDEIMLDLSGDICELFNADQLTLYTVSEDKSAIISKVKTGLNSFKDIKLPIADHSIAGNVALSRRILNIRDVYDKDELSGISPELIFQSGVDKMTGYHTRQMLVAPIVEPLSNELLGVIQLINNKAGTAFAAIHEEGVRSLCETLAIAFVQRNKPQRGIKTKYDYLVHDAVITAQEMELASKTARRKNIDIEEVLINEYQVNGAAIGASLEKYYNVAYEPWRHERVTPVKLLQNLSLEYVQRNKWLPIAEGVDGIVILCLDPEQVKSSRVASNVFAKHKLDWRVTTLREYKQTLVQFFGSAAVDSTQASHWPSVLETGRSSGSDEHDELSEASGKEVVRLVNQIILDAYQQGASDIHIEPGSGKDKVLVRLRKDGSLQKHIEIPYSYRSAIVARIKIMCDLDIAEKRKPQDGKIQFSKYASCDIELRVATVPTAGNVEDVVMRILSAGEPLPLHKLDLLPDDLRRLQSAISKPHGLFLVSGPTGSGKTTTLHSVLKHLNVQDTKIWTAEDPVEITQPGLRQVQVNRKAGMDFAAVMRALLRADPDIIMVGEMRDVETTSIAIEASLTGHMVLATLHTNNAPESISRLLDMGMDSFNFSEALLGVLAQRLAKRLCLKCRAPYTPDAEEMRQFLTEYCEELTHTISFKQEGKAAYEAIYKNWLKQYADAQGRFTFYRATQTEDGGVRCKECSGSGYKGRIGLHELMLGTHGTKKLIQESARVPELLAQALEDGMRTLKQNGMEKVLQGKTDLKQVRAVCIK